MDNAIVLENLKPGTPQAVWDAPATDQIEGFTTDISVDVGAEVDFKINLNLAAGQTAPYHIEIYRLGYYGGDGATLVTTISGLSGVAQPDPVTDARGVVDAGDWSVSAAWDTPDDLVSGVYIAKLVRDDNGGTNQIPFILRDDASTSDIVLQTSDTTWQAYNGWAGRNGEVGGSLYGGFTQPADIAPDVSPSCNGACVSCTCGYNRTFAASYDRPIITRDGGGTYAGAQDSVYGADYAAVYFLEKNGFDVSYISGVDTDRLGASVLQQHKAFISVGHDEYWSGDQRANVEAARDAGVNLLFWSGNEVYWKTRWEPSIADGADYRTLVTYKETTFNYSLDATGQDYANVDPSNQWTGTWRDTRFADAVGPDGVTLIAQGAKPENALTGQSFTADGTGEFGGALDVPASYAGLRFWRDTGVGADGATDIAPGILGYEWDQSPDDASRPAGLVKLSETTLPWGALLTDEGNRTEAGTATHNLTLYRAPSGALVFGAGTVFWSWGLSDAHDGSPYDADIATTALQQFTLNLFADMGIQPGVADDFLANEGLVRASASADHVAATTSFTSIPDTGHALSAMMITGAATDDDHDPATTDGEVAVVEVSTDGGQTWRVAEGTTSWSFAWTPTSPGVYTIESRAIDDSLNLPTAPAITTHTVTVGDPVRPTAFSLFGAAVTPSGAISNDARPLELGMRFQAVENGSVTALRYWRDANDATDTDVRQGHLWSPAGALLGTVTFTSTPGQSGWQTAALSTPVQIEAGQSYIVSYHTNDNYLAATNYFTATLSDPFNELTAPAGGNGLYAYGGGDAAPDQTYGAANYWADLVFVPANSIPAAPQLSASSDTGVSSTDNRTYDDTPTLTGASTAGAVVHIYDGSTQLGSATAAGGGDWSFTAPSLADGSHLLTIRTVTAAGEGPSSAPLALVVDTTAPFAPTAPKLNPADDNGVSGDRVTSITSLNFIGMAADQAGGRASANEAGGTAAYETGGTVTLYDDGVVAGTSVIDGVGHWSATTATLSIGEHHFTARVTDVAGNVGDLSPMTTVTVVRGPPGAPSTPDLSSASDTGSLSADNLTNDTTPTVTGTAAAGTTVSLYDGAAVVGTAITDAAGAWSITSSALADGAHLLTATAATSDGVSPASGVLAVTVDTAAPLAPAAPDMTSASDDGASATDNVTSVTTPTFVVSIPGETSGTVTLYDGGVQVGASGTFSGGDWLITSSRLSAGVHSLTARATDAAGNLGALSAPLSVTILGPNSLFGATAAPTGGLYNDHAELELGVKFQASEDGAITALRYFREAGDASDTDVRAGHLWSTDGALLGAVSFTSGPGQSGWQTATLSTPIQIHAGATYIVSYHTADNYTATSGYFSSSVTSGDLTAPASGAAGGNGVFAYSDGASAPTQSFGAANYWADVLFIPGAVAPTAPSGLSLAAASDSGTVGDGVTNHAAMVVSGAAQAGATVTLYDGATAIGSAVANSAGAFQVSTAALSDGAHSLSAKASFGGQASLSSALLPVTVDTHAPVAPTGLADAAVIGGVVAPVDNTAAQALAGLAEAGARVTVYDGAAALGSVTANGSGQWSFNLGRLADGAHSLTATATDLAGNVGAASAPLAFSVAASPTYSVFTGVSPAGQVFNDSQPIELGMKFEVATDGVITALRYFRGAADANDTDLRDGHIWSSGGVLLGTATFASAPGQSGWQQATLSAPLAVQAGTTYLVSYHTADNYVATGSFFTSTFTDPSGQIEAPSGGNGLYVYGGGADMPTQSYNAANYWVDVVFRPDAAPPAGASVALEAGLSNDIAGPKIAVIVDPALDAQLDLMDPRQVGAGAWSNGVLFV